ncbi:MAG: hypothetical protein ACI8V2_001932 [Candidatus Latescibacterota bacterium]|jgi:hypothetical protein
MADGKIGSPLHVSLYKLGLVDSSRFVVLQIMRVVIYEVARQCKAVDAVG